MAQINKPSEYFDTKIYTQTGSTNNGDTQTITMDNVGMVWIKNRSFGNYHALFDIIRGGNGANCLLSTNTTGSGQGSDIDSAEGLTFGSSTTTIGTDGGGYGYNNRTGDNYVAWHWRTDGTTGSSNTDGSITSTVSANTTSGFSIVTWSGTSSNGTIGHGLGVAPKVIICFGYSSGGNSWTVGHNSLSWNNGIYIEATATFANTTLWQNTAPTNNVFSVGSFSGTNSSQSMIAYCFAEKKGFSKFGSYTGNGNADGTFVYTGFKPAFVLHKRTDIAGHSWIIHDNKRPDYNSTNLILHANLSDAEQGGYDMDLLSNGFKHRVTAGSTNASGGTYIYMAFAEQPLVGTNGVPATAR